jgi:TM2 domain-containing membrane protein YozV
MKNKNTTALLALTAGFVGAHRFYLGQGFLGFLYILGAMGAWFFTFKLMVFIGVIEAIRFLTMSPEEFDQKYNKGIKYNRQEKARQEYQREKKRRDSGWEEMERTWNVQTDLKGFKKEGIAKYKDYDFKGAASCFEKALEQQKDDAPTYFNLACCYSMLEDKALGFKYLATSVALGMKNFEKILSHDGLAYLRIQPEWDNFVSNDYKEVPLYTAHEPTAVTQQEEITPTINQDELSPLDALRQLYEKRQQGLINDKEFELESKRLLN